MTETNPIASMALLKPEMETWDLERQLDVMETAGSVIAGLQVKIVNDEGTELPRDGEAFGELLIRGPWVAGEYFDDPRTAESFVDGWMRTGDVAKITPDGDIRITDRSKDVIKSGGEWISSIDLENLLMAHPAVAEAAVVGVKQAEWGERPVGFVVPVEGASPTSEELLDFLQGKVADWWLPDRIVTVEGIPKTGTGKFDKKVMRDEYSDILMGD
jgi:fatty-acyl-CoA synthase